jgi:hypothetical protein
MTREYPKEYAQGGSVLQASGAIPEIWSGKPVNKSYAKTLRSTLYNTDYSKDVNRRRKKKKKVK